MSKEMPPEIVINTVSTPENDNNNNNNNDNNVESVVLKGRRDAVDSSNMDKEDVELIAKESYMEGDTSA